jgi:hypothetical protein
MINMSDKLLGLEDGISATPIYARKPTGEVLDAIPLIEKALN